MRISDWSSDVCSSDLLRLFPVLPGIVAARHRQTADLDRRRRADIGSRGHRRDVAGVEDESAGAGGARSAWRDIGRNRYRRGEYIPDHLAHRRFEAPDRKSVVEGKRVAVRVDLGGRRIIK